MTRRPPCAPIFRTGARHLFERSFGEDWVAEAGALAGRPPLDLRVNTLISDRDRVLAELDQTGAAPTALASSGLRIPPIAGEGRHPNVQAEPSFQKGWFEVQDEGSQLAAELAGAMPGMQVLDFCAGAGGKTLALAAAMRNKGQIFAYDAEKARLAPIFERIRRAHARNIQVLSKPAELTDARRPDGTGADRRAVHRQRNVAPPAGCQMAADRTAARRAQGRAGEQSSRMRKPM